MRRILIATTIALMLIVLVLYRFRSSRSNLQVEPHAREEIEKAKHR